MSEEVENKGGFFSQLKNQIIAGAGIVLTTLGGIFIDEVKGVLGLSEEEGGAKTEMVQQQQQSQSNSQQVIINIPEQKPAPAQTKTIVKEVPAKPVEKKKEKEDVDW
jgi:hypothetical protein